MNNSKALKNLIMKKKVKKFVFDEHYDSWIHFELQRKRKIVKQW